VAAPLRARAPVPAPNLSSTWEDEQWRLQRLYCEAGQFSCEDGEDGDRVIQLTHHCTDPDWEAVNWAPDGLRFEIKVPAGYPECTSALPALVVTGPADLPERLLQLLPLLFSEAASKAPPSSAAVCRSLQHVDRHLVLLWLKLRAKERGEAMPSRVDDQVQKAEEGQRHEGGAAASSASGLGSWTPEEQARLEAGMAELRSEKDVKKRWDSVALRVGGGKTARDCAERFRSFRAQAVNRGATDEKQPLRFAPQERVEITALLPPPSAPAQAQQQAVAPAMNAAEVRRVGVEVRLLGLVLEGLSTLLPNTLRMQVVCDRCKKPADVESKGQGTDTRGVDIACPTCKQQMTVTVAPSICHGGCAAIAHVAGSGCHPVQLLRSDFEAVCGECTAAAAMRNAGPGFRRRGNCAACFAKTNIAIEGADVLGAGVARWRQVAQEQGEHQTARKQLQDAKRHEKELGIKVGQPLPYQGACKHFQKSYKWLRFPCCGRAVPCNECHDEQTDHPYEWATRMLCGYCSFEQLCNKDKCGNCGAATTRARTTYWEGGEGCRNRTLMSKNDTHKYRGLGKCVSSNAAAKSSAK